MFPVVWEGVMKILNIVDVNLVKIVLTKYYLAKNLEYDFIYPELEAVKKRISEYKPDILVVQSNLMYTDVAGFLNMLNMDIDSDVIVFMIREDADQQEELTVSLSKYRSVHFAGKENFYELFDSLLPSEITRKDPVTDEEMTSDKRTILYVDDSPVMHHFVRTALKDSGFNLIEANDGEEGYEKYCKYLPHIIVTDIEMPKMNGLELCRKIKENNEGRFIPVVILSSKSQPVDIDTAFNFGADDYLVKPVSPDNLIEKVKDYFAVLDRKKRNRILVVDDSKVSAEMISHALIKNSHNVLIASNGEIAYDIALKEKPEIIITDVEMPGMNGYDLVKRLRELPELKDVSVIMMSSRDRKSDIKKSEKLGVARYFIKPFDIEKLVIVVEQLLLEKYNIYKKEYEYMLSTIKALVTALEARDEYTKGHTFRVSKYSLMLGKQMGLTTFELDKLEIAANLHDIGKIGVRDDILLKPGRLSDEEYAKIQEHAVIGAEILRPLNSLNDVVPLILFHHERWDGNGYPTMISGIEIPLGARIIAIADTFDAITSDRPYRKALSEEKAIEIIKENSGTQFCPKCSAAFLEMAKNRKILSE
ncbi:MAG TPA: response regulator [bacterium]|jgi:putative nucleotidyltransferase with HDIG domain|nr:response regulator [bacterium]HQJ59777.1 response regulator [bacterium]